MRIVLFALLLFGISKGVVVSRNYTGSLQASNTDLGYANSFDFTSFSCGGGSANVGFVCANDEEYCVTNYFDTYGYGFLLPFGASITNVTNTSHRLWYLLQALPVWEI